MVIITNYYQRAPNMLKNELQERMARPIVHYQLNRLHRSGIIE